MKTEKALSARFAAFFKNACRDKSGNVMMLFGLGVFVIMGFVGGAVDFSRVALVKRHLQDAADTAVLRTMAMTKATDAQLQIAADQALEDNMAIDDDVSALTGNLVKTVNETSMTQTYTASAVAKSYFGAFFGQKDYTINVVSTATVDLSTYEIAFVLDQTGSMAQSNKMPNLKSSVDSALKSLLDTNGVNVTKSQVAIVPFNLQVRVDNATMNGMVTGGLVKAGSGNCMKDRTQSGNWDVSGNAADKLNANSLYVRTNCAYTTREVQGLSDNIADARNFIQTLTPDGNTNITIGIQWGMETLSSSLPFKEDLAAGNPAIKKYMIVVTDGDNTENANGDNQAGIDKRTALACQAAKDKGITVFTVKVIAGNSAMLKTCASDPSYFFDLKTAAQLNSTMSGIFKIIYKTRLTA